MDIPPQGSSGLPIVLFVGALAARGLFAFLETTITGLRLFTVVELAQKTEGYEHLLAILEKKSDRILVTILIMSSFSEVSAASLGTFLVERALGYFHLSAGLGFSIGIALTTLCIIVLGEIIPKSFAKSHGEQSFSSFLRIISIVYYLLQPIVSVLMKIADVILYCIGYSPSKKLPSKEATWEQEIRFLINYVRENRLLDPQKTELLQNCVDFSKIPVRDIMIPATDIVALDVHTPLADVIDLFMNAQLTRVPVYQTNAENIIGMVHQKDIFILLCQAQNTHLSELVRPILFVPESIKISQLLVDLRQQRLHMAIVLNEHGSITGLITLENLIEQIVGDITDEHQQSSAKIIPVQHGGWIIDASITLIELGNFFHLFFEKESAITLGGFLTERLQHMPKKGERLLYNDLYFQIQKASAKRVHQVLVFQKNNVPSSLEQHSE
jgi:putative hemolysin